MFILIPFSLFSAAVLAMVAYLQSEAAWWKGPLVALGFLLLTVILAFFAGVDVQETGTTPPFIGLGVAAFLGAILIGAASVLALILRKFWSPGKIAKVVFIGGWMLSFVGVTLLAFS